MKTITKLSLSALTAMVITTGAASAHEPSSRLEWRFTAKGNLVPTYMPDRSPTLALYFDRQGFGQRSTVDQRADDRWNAHRYRPYTLKAK